MSEEIKTNELPLNNAAIEGDIFKDEPFRQPKPKLYTVGISGGKDSAAGVLWMVHESGIPLDQIECTFADTGNEHEWTYEHVEKISREIHPVIKIHPEKDYYDLAFSKKRFPGAKSRFCTQFLKIFPSQDYIQRKCKEGFEVISVSGVRADESEDRYKTR